MCSQGKFNSQVVTLQQALERREYTVVSEDGLWLETPKLVPLFFSTPGCRFLPLNQALVGFSVCKKPGIILEGKAVLLSLSGVTAT